MASNPLLSTSKSSDSGLRAALHPLVLLTISDYITRHRLCQQTQPIVGALLGQQIGREITIEVAYDVAVKPPADITTNAEAEKQQPREWKLDDAFFAARLAQYKEVHKAPALDLVGWWTVAPAAGPGPEVLSLHQHVLKEYNESALLLTFVPEAVQNISGSSEQQQRLPLTIYETVYESAARRDEGGGEPMQVEGESEKLEMRFKELGYEIQTGEAEMIGVDSVARSGGNAMVGDGGAAAKAAGSDEKPEEGKKKRGRPPKGKGKIKEESEENVEAVESQDLNAEEEEMLSFLSARANAVRMLHSRITLLKSYLDQLPPSYLTDASSSEPPAPFSPDDQSAPVSHPLLRSIQALTARLPLLAPADTADDIAFARAQQAERSDAALVGLLGSLGESVKQARELGQRFGTVEAQRRERSKGQQHGGGAGWGESAEEMMNGGMGGSSTWDAMML